MEENLTIKRGWNAPSTQKQPFASAEEIRHDKKIAWLIQTVIQSSKIYLPKTPSSIFHVERRWLPLRISCCPKHFWSCTRKKYLFHQLMQLILMDTLLLTTRAQHFVQLCTFILLLGLQLGYNWVRPWPKEWLSNLCMCNNPSKGLELPSISPDQVCAVHSYSTPAKHGANLEQLLEYKLTWVRLVPVAEPHWRSNPVPHWPWVKHWADSKCVHIILLAITQHPEMMRTTLTLFTGRMFLAAIRPSTKWKGRAVH